MTERDNDKPTKADVIKLFDRSSPRRSQSNKVLNIQGDGNIIGNHNTTVQTERVVHKHTAQVHPGDEHITDDQAFILKSLVDEVVKYEETLKRGPKGYQTVWGSLNRHCRATSYRLIKREHFIKAEKYLRTWIGRLNASKSAPSKAPDWRKRKYAYIKTNTRQFSLDDKLTEYLETKYGVSSLTELDDEQLNSVYQAVSRWRP